MTWYVEAIQSRFVNAVLVDKPSEKLILGKKCYVGDWDAALDTEELSVTAIPGRNPRPGKPEIALQSKRYLIEHWPERTCGRSAGSHLRATLEAL